MKRDRYGAELSAVGADEIDSIFDAASKKAVEAVGGRGRMCKKRRAKAPTGRDLPRGVQKTLTGNFASNIRWGDKTRYIGTFDAPEQASAAYMSVRKDLDDAKSSGGADEVNSVFDAAKNKALELCLGRVSTKRHGLPRGVYELRSGKFQSSIRWGDKTRYIGTFDTSEQASAAHTSARKELGHAKQSACGSNNNKVKNAAFDAAKKKALEAAQAA